MAISLSVPEQLELKPRITVFGVGGAGGNAVSNMIDCGLEGVEFVVANTDAQALSQSRAARRIQMGETATQGLGAGSHPEVGRAAAEEALEEITDHLSGCHMVFVTAGMGGGTGTGAAPVIARAARELGILTVAVVTKPFQFEGARRMRIAETGLAELAEHVDTMLVIPNQNLFRVANKQTTFAEAFGMADQVLFSGVSGITDLMISPGLINLDFADVRAVMGGAGAAMMGAGEAEGENRATEAAESAISNPLLEDVSLASAKGVLINIIGGADLTLFEVEEATSRVSAEVDPEANIVVGSTLDPNLEGRMRVSVVATGVDNLSAQDRKPKLAVSNPAVEMREDAAGQTEMPGLSIVAGEAAAEAELKCESEGQREEMAEAGENTEPVAELTENSAALGESASDAAEDQPEPAAALTAEAELAVAASASLAATAAPATPPRSETDIVAAAETTGFVMPPAATTQTAAHHVTHDPLAGQPATDGVGAEKTGKSGNFLERMGLFGRRKRVREAAFAEAAEQSRIEPYMQTQKPASAAAATAASTIGHQIAETEPAQQQKNPGDIEQLEIPAFLRRTAG